MKYVALICRILLGLMFMVFGANLLHPFLPMPTLSGPPLQFFMLFGPTGWMKVIGAFQLIGGLLVLAGGTLPLGLCILCPITVNILCFHLLVQGSGAAPGFVTALLEIVLIYAYRASFAGVLSASQKPSY